MRSRPVVGQWCCAMSTSVLSPKATRASSMYLAHRLPSRTSAPRIVYRLCMLCVTSSAMLSTRNCGRYMSISDGASEPGTSWNTICTPSMVRSSVVFSMVEVGAISVTLPRASALPRPVSTWPRAPGGSSVPNWYCERRFIALPARMFSATADSMKPEGAITCTLPAATSASLTTPFTPPKWSAWPCV
ncbi:hypothetical protein FQZ97_468820 [compost metagenome]